MNEVEPAIPDLPADGVDEVEPVQDLHPGPGMGIGRDVDLDLLVPTLPDRTHRQRDPRRLERVSHSRRAPSPTPKRCEASTENPECLALPRSPPPHRQGLPGYVARAASLVPGR